MKQVALLIETSNACARGVLRGIVACLREHRSWSLCLADHGWGDCPPSWLRDWCGDGIIARIETSPMAKALRRLQVPIVDVSAARLIPSLPWFETDDPASAQMACEHLCGQQVLDACRRGNSGPNTAGKARSLLRRPLRRFSPEPPRGNRTADCPRR